MQTMYMVRKGCWIERRGVRCLVSAAGVRGGYLRERSTDVWSVRLGSRCPEPGACCRVARPCVSRSCVVLAWSGVDGHCLWLGSCSWVKYRLETTYFGVIGQAQYGAWVKVATSRDIACSCAWRIAANCRPTGLTTAKEIFCQNLSAS